MSDAIAAATPATPPPAPQPSHLWKDGKSFGFHDLLDLINPLQHLPIIGAVYRWATGDEPGDVARVAGDTLYGGPIGLALGLLATATEDDKGRDLGERTVAALFGSGGDDASPPKATATAAVSPAPVPATSAAWLSAFPDVAKNGAPSPAAVARLYTSPAAAPAQKTEATAPPVLDHPPMPLLHRVGAAGAAPRIAVQGAVQRTAAEQNPAARAFLARTAMLQRPLAAGRGSPEERQFNNHPVPLQLSGGLSFSLEQPHTVRAAPSSPIAVTPAQISQKMMEALDKYRRLQQQLNQQNAAAESAPGGADLTPEGSPPPQL
jgi:hypothetical protein